MDASVKQHSLHLQKADNKLSIASASALPIGENLKEYRITGIIGEGGFGIVYSAEDILLKRNVAIKEYMPAAIANRLTSLKTNLRSTRHQKAFEAGKQGFIDEARLLAQFKHPALVEILQFWETNNTAYIVMPHYSGKTLRNLLRQNRNVCTEKWLKSILSPILDAVELLHKNNIFHRDIAPDNIVIKDDHQPVLLDLGSARRVIAGMQSALTVVVKPGYAPIEQYTEDTVNDQGAWTDIYALGAVLYFSITGSAPVASVSRMMRDTLKTLTIEEYPQFSNEFIEAINRALELRPLDRFQSIDEFRQALKLNSNASKSIPTKWKVNEPAETDDEITQVLSEEEISEFKEKLLNTLSRQNTITGVQRHLKLKGDENTVVNRIKTENKTLVKFCEDNGIDEKKYNIHDNDGSKKAKENPYSDINLSEEKKNKNSRKTAFLLINICIVLSAVTIALGYIFIDTKQKLDNPKTINSPSSGNSASLDNTLYGPIEVDNSAHKLQLISNNLPLTQEPITTTLDAKDQPNKDLVAVNASYQDKPVSTDTINENNQTQPALPSKTAPSEKIIKSEITKDSNKIEPHRKPEKTIRSQDSSIRGTAKLTLLPWGEIWVDNQRYGVSPPTRILSLAPGTYHIELRNPAAQTETRIIHFNQGENNAIYHNFSSSLSPKKEIEANSKSEQKNTPVINRETEQASNTALSVETESQTTTPISSERILKVKVIPWGEIFINGKIVGITPPLHQLKLEPGSHTLEIRHPNYPVKIIKISAADSLTETIEHHFK